ncbi:Per1-like protein [Irpex rosettiformis]|uniref:Per1-like protein n=1 Tax=Irpex rosettiformis TaxID=378272 RepID=A0ACB8UHX7_9APHY|nr:Per1-like protein [Irpex rosettiformis]
MRTAIIRGRCLLLPLFLATFVLASSGDRAQEYQDCVSACQSQVCIHEPHNTLPLALRLTGWTCLDNCKYECMHTITTAAIRAGSRVHQYHGKWPFWRFAGMQEPASVVFSMLNLVYHVKGYSQIQKRIPDNHPMKWYYRIFAFVSMNAWIWSSVFHTRDLPQTEKLDYFSAALAILFALFYTAIRLFHLYPQPAPKTTPKVTGRIRKVWASLCSLAYLCHISYLTLLPRFDYTYNMIFNLTVGLAHNILWLIYSLPSAISLIRRFPARAKTYRPRYAWKAAAFVIITTLATSLEVFDFPAWGRIIDAHSLWHLATVPIIPLWYQFLIQDALDDGWKGPKQE